MKISSYKKKTIQQNIYDYQLFILHYQFSIHFYIFSLFSFISRYFVVTLLPETI